MAQYYPIHRAASNEKYAALNRSITAAEWEEALAALEANGLVNGFQQELETANRYYRPDFRDRETPFRDIRDFQRRTLAKLRRRREKSFRCAGRGARPATLRERRIRLAGIDDRGAGRRRPVSASWSSRALATAWPRKWLLRIA